MVGETPELAALFAKHFKKDRTQIYARLNRMGRHAEVAVPRLIETFLVLWKKRENEMRAWAANSRDNEVVRDATFDDESPLSSQERMVDVLNVLGAIGPGAKAAVPLLQQIVLLAPSKRVGQPLSLDDKFFDAVKETLAKIGEIPATDAKDSPVLLSEFFRLQSRWNLTSTKPEVDHKDIQFDFNDGLSIQDKHDNRNSSIVGKIMNQLDTPSSRMHFRINDTASPRQIDLIHEQGERTQLGIYELSANRLKIQLAKPGKPRPKEFSPDKDKLPEGHTLLEFERDVTPASEPVP